MSAGTLPAAARARGAPGSQDHWLLAGLAYKLEFVDESEPEDIVFENHGVKVLIDPQSLAYIDGTELDFVREGLNEGFKFNNPNEQ